MKFLLSALMIAMSVASATAGKTVKPFIQKQVTAQTQINAVKGIIKRTTPQVAEKFTLEIIPKADGKDVFEIETPVAGAVTLRGNNGVSLASAYEHYLKTYCHTMILWCGNQKKLPSTLPTVPQKVRIICPHLYRPYLNYCTLNYTASWWNWDRWEREIDIMAMKGINMPLSVIGLEGVWYYTLLEYGFTDKEAREYLVGPTYFAWQWMTNIQSHGGPLPKEWIDKRIVLGRKILERQRALGMTPIQQGFSGCVPRLLKKKYPKANIVSETNWCLFEGTDQLDPLDPLFVKFGTTFLKTEKKLFGTSHIYAADPFHEGRPPRPGKAYLHKVGEAIYNLVNNFDPGCTWAMQSWSIRKDIACAIPKKQLLVLDLAGYHKDFWGYDFVKGQLHNFGGRINMHGDLNDILSNPFAKAVKNNPKCKGMGLFMEGIEQNPVFYEAVFDMIWRDGPVDVNQWLKDYSLRRYGKKSEKAEQAWQLLLKGPYKRGTGGVEKGSIVAARPALYVEGADAGGKLSIPYDPQLVIEAWKLLLADSKNLQSSEGYRFDVVDLARQTLTNLGQEITKDAAVAFVKKDRKLFKLKSQQFLELILDMDKLLATTSTYNFGRWINDARSWGDTEEQKRYYEWNACMLVTIWGPEKNPELNEYAWREWAGLIRSYYYPRWQKFYTMLDEVLSKGGDYYDPKTKGLEHKRMRVNSFYNQLADWEISWIHSHHDIPATPQGDPVEMSKNMLKKYAPVLKSIYSPKAVANRKNAYQEVIKRSKSPHQKKD